MIFLLVDDGVQGQQEQENHQESLEALAVEREARAGRRGGLPAFCGARVFGHEVANKPADIRICGGVIGREFSGSPRPRASWPAPIESFPPDPPTPPTGTSPAS